MATLAHEHQAISQRTIGGIIGGLAGGIVFGVMMAMMGMLPMVAGLVGSQSAPLGLVVHLIISLIVGAGFGILLGARASSYRDVALWGLFYGFVWWVLGPLVIMPLLMGMGLQFSAAFTPMMLQSLMGHLIFGAITGIVYAWYTKRLD